MKIVRKFNKPLHFLKNNKIVLMEEKIKQKTAILTNIHNYFSIIGI